MREISDELTYASNGVKYTDREEMGKLIDIFQKTVVEHNSALNGKFPPGYYDNIVYKHREEAYKLIGTSDDSLSGVDNLFRIGDCFFIIPPEYISVSVENGHNSIQGIRQGGSIQMKHGYSRKDVHVSLVLNGINQINGYKVNSPFEYSYYMDGLRTLISQFKYTPFLPIENPLINLIHDVNAVALRSISVSTLEGFPETLRVDISMQEFNAKAYVLEDECIFGEMFDWDLFRYYIQQPLRENKNMYLSKITNQNLTSEFNFKILKSDALNGYKINDSGDITVDNNGKPIYSSTDFENLLENHIDITEDKYFEEMISDKDNVELTALSFGMSNIMPVIQLSDHEAPTHQFFGTTDTEISLSFKTTDEVIVSKFEDMNSQNQSLVRDNREVGGIGFMKITNELINLTGTNFVLINDINISTVPGFPNLYSISLSCLSYDSNQKESEKLISFKPFSDNRKGTKNDLITQEPKGITNKIKQDKEAERKLMDIELYPDLHLPTYEEMDNAISKIRSFRSSNGLIDQMAITKLPKNTCEMPGNIKEVEYSKYVDPDFYIMYISKLSDMTASSTPATINKIMESESAKIHTSEILEKAGDNIIDSFALVPPKPNVTVEPDYVYGYDDEEIRYNHSDSLGHGFGGGSSSGSGGAGNDGGGNTSSPGNGNPSVDPTRVKKKYGNPFVDFCCDRADAGCGYVWAAHGQIYSKELRQYYIDNKMGASNYVGTEKWYGIQSFDCSGLICWAMRKVGLKPDGFRVVSGQFGNYGTRVPPNEIQVGDVFYDGAHCGIVLDGGKTVEAMNTNAGVCYGTVNKGRYTFVRFSGLKEANATFLKNNKNFYNTSNGAVVGGGGDIITSPYSLTIESDSNIKPSKLMRMPGGNDNASDGGGKLKPTKLANFGNNNPCDKWNNEIMKNATYYNIDPNIIKCIIRIESGGDPKAISAYDYPKIVGLMQVYLKYHSGRFKGSNYFDPEDNIYAGTSIIRDYASAGWVDFDLERTLASYNHGPGGAYNVIIDKEYPMPEETKNYITKFKTYYQELKNNGAEAGNLRTFKSLGNSTGGGGGSNDGSGNDYFPDMPGEGHNDFDGDTPTNIALPNKNAGKTHGDSIEKVNFDIIGKSNLEFISKATAINNKFYSFDGNDLGKELSKMNTNLTVEYMFHDMVHYSQVGRLSRAFPSFLFVIIDEQADWIDKSKLWSNYYVYRSVLDISVHQAYDNPISTAKVTISNFYNNLSKIISRPTTESLLNNGFTKLMYNLTGAVINEHISDEMLRLKNQLRDELFLHEGARIHIRMGYGSNPAKYPTSFNGTITSIEHGELITIIAQSDGMELINQPLTDKTNQTNEDMDLPAEVSNIAARLLCARQSDFLYNVTGGNASLNSRHCIEHFGTFFDGIDGIDFKNFFDKDNWDGLYLNPSYLLFNEFQYDLVQNIYKGRYDAIPYSALKFAGIDGESNWRFFVSGRNTWDVLKMCEKSMPDFIAYPRYFGFESRLFYGVPAWLYGYNYEIDYANGDLYRRSKSFAQVHDVNSLTSIIDNEITIDTRNLYTNFVGVYTLGGDLATTPAIMSDSKIDWGRQRTKTIDTTSVQDFNWVPGIIDKYLEWSKTFENGKKMAIMVCVSELMNSWKESYTGSLLVIGKPEVNVHDYIYLEDTAIKMNGMVTVREVVHSMNVSTGFTTSITPGMIALNTLEQSGMGNIYKSIFFLAKNAGIWYFCKMNSLKVMALASKTYTSSKMAVYVGSKLKTVASFTATKGKDVYDWVRTGKAVTKFSEFVKKIDILCDVGKYSKKLFDIGKDAVATVASTSLFTPHGLIAVGAMILTDLLFGWLITFVHDAFAYRNCIVINPLMIAEKDGTVKAYAGNIKGGTKILPIDDVETSEEA